MLEVVLADGPPPPGFGRAVNAWRDDEGAAFAEATAGHDRYRLEWRDVGVMTFASGSTEVRLWPAPGLAAESSTSAVLHVVQPVILQALGHQALHASGVHFPAGVVAFCGVSGTGKSTLAFALGQRPGLSQIADDALVLTLEGGRATVHPLPFRPRLRPSSRAFLAPRPAPETAPHTSSPAAPLLAVFLLQPPLDDRTIDVRRVCATHAFSALLTHAHCFDASDRTSVAALVRDYLALADAVPVYSLDYPRDFSSLRAVEARVVEVLAGQSRLAGHA